MKVRFMKKRKTIKCLHCGHILDLTKYGMMYPDKDTPDDKIMDLHDPNFPRASYLCTCGCYTVNQFSSVFDK